MSVFASLLIYLAKPSGLAVLGIGVAIIFGAGVAVGERFIRDCDRVFQAGERLKMIVYSVLVVELLTIISVTIPIALFALVNQLSFKVSWLAFLVLLEEYTKEFSSGMMAGLLVLGLALQVLVFFVTYGPVMSGIKERKDEFG